MPVLIFARTLEQVQLIVGKTADPAILKKLTYIGMTKSMVCCFRTT
jgi:hypothetical protein